VVNTPRWVSWRQGRNFVKWHARTGAMTVKCGALIPAGAAKCYAADEFVATYQGGVCVNCRKLLLQERIPK